MIRVTDASAVLPGRCFVCERQFEDGESAVNTTFTYSPDWDTKLFGNKMVCDNCTHDIAETAGYVDGREVGKSINAMREAHALEIAEHERVHAEYVASMVVDPEALAQRIAELVKPKPRTKAASV